MNLYLTCIHCHNIIMMIIIIIIIYNNVIEKFETILHKVNNKQKHLHLLLLPFCYADPFTAAPRFPPLARESRDVGDEG